MDAHKEAIWNRGNAREIMKEARKRYGGRSNSASFSTTLASTHYSLVKRYVAPAPIWLRCLAVWHMWRAVVHVRKAHRLGSDSYSQLLVVAEILTRAPRWLGGSPRLAIQISEDALAYAASAPNEMAEMVPHDEALFHVALAQAREKNGTFLQDVEVGYRIAVSLKERILAEPDREMAEKQWVRIAFAAGIWYHTRNWRSYQRDGADLIREAHRLAESVSLDQLEKIRAWASAHDFSL